jgi:hypothetical protein
MLSKRKDIVTVNQFWTLVGDVNCQNKRLKQTVDAMTIVEYNAFMKERFELCVFYEVIRRRRLLTKKMIYDIYESVYHPPMWDDLKIVRVNSSWGNCDSQRIDKMVDGMFSFWNKVGDVPFS